MRDITGYQAVCSHCGKQFTSMFRPVTGRPIFCQDCFKQGELNELLKSEEDIKKLKRRKEEIKKELKRK